MSPMGTAPTTAATGWMSNTCNQPPVTVSWQRPSRVRRWDRATTLSVDGHDYPGNDVTHDLKHLGDRDNDFLGHQSREALHDELKEPAP